MDIRDFELLVRYEMDKYGLSDWQWKYNRATSGMCSCNRRLKLLKFCRPYVELNELHLVLDTILHEIAHALVPKGSGHGSVWKAKCLEIGCRPERFHRAETITAKAKYTCSCPECGISGQRRKIDYSLICKRCRVTKGHINRLVWVKN